MLEQRERIVSRLSYDLLNVMPIESYQKVMGAITIALDEMTDTSVRIDDIESILKIYKDSLIIQGCSQRTINVYYGCLKRILLEINKPINEIKTFDIKLWLAKKQDEVSFRTCENYRSYLYSFFNWLTKEEYIDKNPMLRVNVIKYERKIKKPFSKTEIEKLRNACDKIRDRAILELLLSTGMRVSELCNTNISDVDFDDKSIVIKKTKSKVQRIVFMNDTSIFYLTEYLENRKDDLDYLFISQKNNRISSSAVERMLHKIGNIAHVENVHPHRCRRTFATTLYQRGMGIRTIQQLMGHSDINTTVIYVGCDTAYLKREFEKYS